MARNSRSRPFSVLAGACFAVIILYYLLFGGIGQYALSLFKNIDEVFGAFSFDMILPVLELILLTALAVSFFAAGKVFVMVTVGLATLLDLYSFLSPLIREDRFHLYMLIGVLAYAALFLTVLLAKKRKRAVSFLWILPLALILAYNVLYHLKAGWGFSWEFYLIDLLEIAAFLFAGLWLKESLKEIPPKPYGFPPAAYQPYRQPDRHPSGAGQPPRDPGR